MLLSYIYLLYLIYINIYVHIIIFFQAFDYKIYIYTYLLNSVIIYIWFYFLWFNTLINT